MLTTSIIQYVLFLAAVTFLVKPSGLYLAAVFEGRWTLADPLLRPIERFVYFLTRVRTDDEMGWKRYTIAFICFSLVGNLMVYGLLRLQNHLPGGPADTYLTTPITPDLAFNTGVSFSTTTTWQAYAGENTMKYWTQILAFVGQNFLAGAAGLAIGIAFIRGFSRRDTGLIGNFWVDLVRATLWVLIPISIIGSLLLIWQGVPMNFHPYTQLKTLSGDAQIIAQGPVGALEFIEQLGIAVLPASLIYTFGAMTGRKRAGWALYAVMVFLFAVAIILFDHCERPTPPRLAEVQMTGGNMEGKEVRFGIGSSTLTAIVTSNGATGSVNAAPDSLTPLGAAVPLANMLLGEITFGGLGTGFYSMIMIALVGLFMAGLMVGRTPEYIGKRIGPREMKSVMLFNLATPIAVLALTACATVSTAGLAGLSTNNGPHGFTEILFGYASCMANNGQAMAGLSTGTPFYNLTTAAIMMIGRFGVAVPALALAGMLAAQGRRVVTAGSLPCDSFLFGVVVVGSALLVGGLNFFPAIALGPVIEHFLMSGSRGLF
jgi:K+-transporting ATPase ATPase A chain